MNKLYKQFIEETESFDVWQDINGWNAYSDDYVEWLEAKIDYAHSSTLLKNKEAISFEEYLQKFNERTIDGELFYETEKGLKSIEEVEDMYYVYANL